MAQISGGKVWWMPIGSEDLVRVTDDVMSYEIDGELRLSTSLGTVKSIGLTEEAAAALALPYEEHPDHRGEQQP
jgi:hypothetical protein